jgi:hypothetical protein
MKKVFLILLVVGISVSVFFFIKQEEKRKLEKQRIEEFISCLKEAGVVIYGSSVCPACAQLEKEYGGKEVLKPIYLDCSGRGPEQETKECNEKLQTGFVPEIQINGALFDAWGSPQALAQETGCDY